MKLSTRSRYGTRMMIDLAEHYGNAPVHIGDIAKRQDISVKYLEQLIIPLKKAQYIKSIRGPKGGHMLAKAPEEISMGQIVRLFEGQTDLVACVSSPQQCARTEHCRVRDIWIEATNAVFEKLDDITIADLVGSEEKDHC